MVNFKIALTVRLSHVRAMPIRKVHPYAKGCDEPQFVTDAREAAQIFDGRFAGNDALQTYFLSVLAGGGSLYTGDSPYGFFGDATQIGGTGGLLNGVIVDNGTYRVELPAGKYAFGALGNFQTKTLAVRFSDGTDFANFVDASNPLTAAGGFVFHNPTNYVEFVVTGGGAAPSIKIYLNPTR